MTVYTKEYDEELMGILSERLLDLAIDIWKNRADSKVDDRQCPLCTMKVLKEQFGFVEPNGIGCKGCILGGNDNDCFATPYGVWDAVIDWNEAYEKKPVPMKPEVAAGHMVKMLEAYRDGDMDTFESYRSFYKGVFGDKPNGFEELKGECCDCEGCDCDND